MGAPRVVVIRPAGEAARRLWQLVLSLADEFGADREWSLVGGLMVQLHGFEHDDDPRPTADIDVLGDARRPPQMTEALAEILVGRGGAVVTPPRSNPKLGYRFEVEGEIVEVLGPDGLSADPKTTAGLRTFQAAGGTQALHRTEVVLVALDGAEPVSVRRPDLLGAILIKARVAARRRKGKFPADRQDLIRLLSYVDNPRELGADLTRKEGEWLRDVEGPIDFDDGSLAELFPAGTLLRSRQALRLLVQAGSPAASSTK